MNFIENSDVFSFLGFSSCVEGGLFQFCFAVEDVPLDCIIIVSFGGAEVCLVECGDHAPVFPCVEVVGGTDLGEGDGSLVGEAVDGIL